MKHVLQAPAFPFMNKTNFVMTINIDRCVEWHNHVERGPLQTKARKMSNGTWRSCISPPRNGLRPKFPNLRGIWPCLWRNCEDAPTTENVPQLGMNSISWQKIYTFCFNPQYMRVANLINPNLYLTTSSLNWDTCSIGDLGSVNVPPGVQHGRSPIMHSNPSNWLAHVFRSGRRIWQARKNWHRSKNTWPR